MAPYRAILRYCQERKGHINLREMPGTPAGCPRDTRRDKRGSTGRCPRDFLLVTIEKRTEKAIFAGTPAGCPRDTRPSRGFSEILCDFFLCAFSAPYCTPYLHFIADTDTDENDFGIIILAADTETAVLCSLEGGA